MGHNLNRAFFKPYSPMVGTHEFPTSDECPLCGVDEEDRGYKDACGTPFVKYVCGTEYYIPAEVVSTPKNARVHRPMMCVNHDVIRTRIRKAIDVAERYGTTDGAHHKQWVISQMLLELMGQEKFDAFVKALEADGCKWNPGVAP